MNIDVMHRLFMVFIEKCRVDLIFQSVKKSSEFRCECVWCEVGMYQRLVVMIVVLPFFCPFACLSSSHSDTDFFFHIVSLPRGFFFSAQFACAFFNTFSSVHSNPPSCSLSKSNTVILFHPESDFVCPESDFVCYLFLR